MATTTSYENYKGEPIDKPEKECEIIYKEDGIIKKIEHVEYYTVVRYTYYLASDENIITVLNEFSNVYIDIIERTKYGNYEIEQSTVYDNNKIYTLGKILYDQFGNDICWQDYDVFTGKPIFEKTQKNLFDDHNKKRILWFEYDGEGMIYRVQGQLVEDTDQRPEKFIHRDEMPLYFPNLLTENTYYKNADFLPNVI